MKRRFKRKELATPEKIQLRRYIFQTSFLLFGIIAMFLLLKNCHLK